ncbi:hypothetical protein N7520_002440 [Penicillium odoratum]|uniref:uncharacterized protein n=1 Tax=Penicillium odoratum TaxID=1167516 RepID=UPI0025493C1E|nr:uncharacterized protein N7520_002440 [Penicillium odoratum]KAJ5771911.1 hypothetical protein N7520_002440 [Penicillium odoratum]
MEVEDTLSVAAVVNDDKNEDTPRVLAPVAIGEAVSTVFTSVAVTPTAVARLDPVPAADNVSDASLEPVAATISVVLEMVDVKLWLSEVRESTELVTLSKVSVDPAEATPDEA